MAEIQKTSADFTKTWRYKTGLTVFVIGNLMVPLSPLVKAFGLPSAYIPVLIVLGEVLIFSTIIILGKQGFLELKNKLKQLFKRKPVEELKPVSRFRHVTGLIMVFAVPLLLNLTVLVFGIFTYPALTTAPHGKLRLLFELQPMAFLVEQAGGKATDGHQNILDIVPTEIDQRNPIYIGSQKEVNLANEYLNQKTKLTSTIPA